MRTPAAAKRKLFGCRCVPFFYRVTESGLTSHAMRIMFSLLPTVMVSRWCRLGRYPSRIVLRPETDSVAMRLRHNVDRQREKARHYRDPQFRLPG